MSRKWIVHTKGRHDDGFEICVIRADNVHGLASYGWFDENKILISSSGSPCNTKIPFFVWQRLVALAESLVLEMNLAERDPIEVTASEVAEQRKQLPAAFKERYPRGWHPDDEGHG